MNKSIENLKKLKSFHNGSYGTDIDKSIIALEFAEWVAEEIFSDDWEYNKDSFEEIACRKLEKMGIVRKTETDWELADNERVRGMTKAELMKLVGKKVYVYFKDGDERSGILGYVDKFPERFGYRKPNYFYIGNTQFKASNVKKVIERE